MIASVRSGSGALDWWTDGRRGRSPLVPGDVSIQPAGRFLHSGDMAGVVCDTFSFAPGFLSRLASDDRSAEKFVLQTAAGTRDPLLAHMLALVADHVPRRGEWADSLATSELLVRIGAYLIETHANDPRPLKRFRNGLERWRLRRVLEFIEQHLASPIDLSQLAQAAGGMSQYHFSRLFRQSTGLAPHRFLIQRRLAAARSLLSGRKQDLLSVALATGFCDHTHLTRRFRQYFGITPSEFARRR